MKKIATLSVLSLGILFLAGCGKQPVSQTQPIALAPVVQTPAQQLATPPIDEVASWKMYTNPTFGYSIKYPATWTEKQGKVLEAGVSEDKKNSIIEFYNNDTLTLRILTDFKTKVGDPSLSSLASEVPSPIDKTTISGVVVYKIGSLDGYKRLVVVSDPPSQGLEYITKDSKYIYHMSTFDKTESEEVVNMLKTFSTK
jgi:hypothetical protein